MPNHSAVIEWYTRTRLYSKVITNIMTIFHLIVGVLEIGKHALFFFTTASSRLIDTFLPLIPSAGITIFKQDWLKHH
jgi:hypothetical protein